MRQCRACGNGIGKRSPSIFVCASCAQTFPSDYRESKPLPAKQTAWSTESQKLLAQYRFSQQYRDRIYNCANCGRCTVFTAAQQKVAYEGLKLHVLLERPLCPECWTGHRALAKELRAIQCEWRQHSSQLRLDRVFLLRWQAVLNGLSKLAGRRNPAILRMLEKRLLALDAVGAEGTDPGA